MISDIFITVPNLTATPTPDPADLIIIEKSSGIDRTRKITFANLTALFVQAAQSGANYRFKDGQHQTWDAGYAAADPTKPWAVIYSNNGVLLVSPPIAD
jgi:hypothetical protein